MSESELSGRFGIVTGGAGPLGWELCLKLVQGGASVLAVDLPGLTETRARAPMPAAIDLYPCDLLAPGALDELREEVSRRGNRVDFLVNNAAFTGASGLSGYACAFEDQSDEAFDAALSLNLSVPFKLVRRLLPALRHSSDGVVINVSSIYGLVGPDLRLYEGTNLGSPAGYAASKGGLTQLTRYLATVLAPDLRVNCIAPGGIARGQDPTFVERYVARTPLARIATEDDVAEAVRWLVGPGSRYVSGQVIAVDGGWTAW